MNVFDTGVGLQRVEMYRAWVFPDEFPRERQPVLGNWHTDDLRDLSGLY